MRYLTISILLILNLTVSAQLPKMTVTAPTAASIVKFADIPVNNHTGIPNLSIPIHTVTQGPLTVPITLSYHGGGLRVMEHASWVGSGWTLNAGGVITRTPRGAFDEISHGSGSYLSNQGYYKILFLEGNIRDISSFANGLKDGEPDLFFFSFNEYSGKFYFRADNSVMLESASQLTVQPLLCEGQGCVSLESLYGFVITTPDGNKYYFGKTININDDVDALEYTRSFSESGGGTFAEGPTSWYLNKITSADGLDEINFVYSKEQYSFFNIATREQTSVHNQNDGISLIKQRIDGVRLSKITYNKGLNSISFAASESLRQDLSRYGIPEMRDVDCDDQVNGPRALKTIKVEEGSLCKEFSFTHTYFYNGHPIGSRFERFVLNPEQEYNLHTDKKRLKLDAVQERSCDQSILLPAHEFTYYDESSVPRTLSLGQDHWGFYNGRDENLYLMPASPNIPWPSGNRDSSWPQMRAGALRIIKYPTGGTSEIVYGHHQKSVVVGGLRVDQLRTIEAPNTPALITDYDYKQSDGTDSGVLFGVPIYVCQIRNDFVAQAGLNMNSTTEPAYDGFIMDPTGQYVNYAFSPGSVHPLQNSQGAHFGYRQVKVKQPGKGATIYFYNASTDGLKQSPVTSIPSSKDFDAINWPPAPTSFNPNRGTLQKIEVYNEEGHLQKETITETTFTQIPEGITGYICKLHAMHSDPTFGSSGGLSTIYEIKTWRKASEKTTELIYDQMTPTKLPAVKLKETFFGSKNHSFLTKETVYAASLDATNRAVIKGKVLGERTHAYPLDVKIGACDNPYTAFNTLESAILDYWYDYQEIRYRYSTDAQRVFNAWQTYFWNVNEARKQYVQNRITHFQTNGLSCETGSAYSAADVKLKALIDLKQLNNVEVPLETQSSRDGKFIGSTLLTYSKYMSQGNRGDGIFPSLFQTITTTEPGTPSAIEPLRILNNTTYSTDSRYLQEQAYKFANGRQVEVTERNGVTTSYIWGYNNRYVVAQVVNARYAQIYYNSFEESQQGGTSGGSVTGSKYYNNGSISLNISLPSGLAYQMSYWYFSQGQWVFSGELPFSSSISTAGTRLDEIRVYPKGANMTTYAYEEGFGIASIIDPNNFKTSYQYDKLGRLKAIIDKDGNVMQSYQYRYKNQSATSY
jgi:YD repeat-containing protein